jgi:AcrR family transcriptional regulator
MPKPDLSDQRKAQIIEAAAATFARLGLGIARMEDVAQAAGLSKGTLYLYFKSKDALVEALIHTLFEPFTQSLDLLNSGGCVSQRIQTYTDSAFAVFAGIQSLYPLVFELFALARRQDSARIVVENYVNQYKTALQNALDEGIRTGEFLPLDSRTYALMILALVDGMVQLAVLNPSEVDVQRDGEKAVQALLSSIQREKRE